MKREKREKREKSFRKRSWRLHGLATCVAAALTLGAALAHASLPGTEVGRVTFVLGKAWITKPGGNRVPVAVGTEIGVYDRIDTASNGHVHVRLVDTALISVRPSSTLEIQRYDYNAADPAASAIKLNLIEGESRAISGDAAQKARQNFRLNTPVAAIGVRGTDFVTIAGSDGIEARVNEGAIIVAPFSSDCSRDALGPCSGNALELAYNYGANQIVQVTAAGDSVMLPISSSGLPESIVDQSLEPQVAAQGGEKRNGELYTESVAALAVNPRLIASRGPQRPDGPGVPTTPAEPDFTPSSALTTQALENRQLMWGRWYERPGADERLTVSWAYGSNLDGRKFAIGNDEYLLFRTEDNLPRVKYGLGAVGFELNSAQAFYRSNAGNELLNVSGGRLNVDFGTSTFSTSLSMRSATLGPVDFSASGVIDANSGRFNIVSPTTELGGIVTHDGSEAGYYFERLLESGTIDGITLWGRKP